MSNQINPEDFILRALKTAKKEKGIAHIHTVYDGLNAALREYYGSDIDVIKLTDELVTKGLIRKWPVKGGAMLALISADEDKIIPKKAAELLAKIKAFEK